MGEPVLDRDDLDELGDTAYEAADPTGVAAELIAVAVAGRLADRADAGHAYRLAAEIYQRVDDLPQALAAAEQAVAAHTSGADGAARALCAELLLRLGREREAMAELSTLRPLMSSDPLAASYVPEALVAGGRAELARQWVTGALAERTEGDPDDPVVAQLRTIRDRLPEQDAGGDGDDLPEVDAEPGYDEDGPAEAVLLVWPEAEYEQVDERWPEVLEATGADGWQDYRRRQQLLIANWTRRRRGSLWMVTGSAAGFAEFLAEQGADLADADLVALADGYGDQLFEQTEPVLLPPAAGDACWCGAPASYEECCRRLASAHR